MTVLKTMLLRPITEIFNVNSSGTFNYQCALTKFYGISQKSEFYSEVFPNVILSFYFHSENLCFLLSNKHLYYFLLSLFLARS